jgi:2,5-furandicarboxylate decarboxylase 1
MYRIMVTGPNTMTINAAPDHDLGRIFAAAAQRGTDVDISVAVGHHPAYFVASQLKNPVHVDTHRVAGALLGTALRVTPAVTVDLEAPADAELVLEGVVHPTERTSEGPFGEFTYYYGAAQAPVCTVTAIRRRSDAIFHDLHPTHDEHRCLWLFPGREARLLEAVRRVVPGVTQVRIPFHSGSLTAYASVRKTREGDGRQAILATLATDHFIKHVVVVDDDIDIHDDAAVLWASQVRAQATTDLLVLPGMKGIRMDPSARPAGETGDRLTDKTGLDATRPVHTPFPDRADLPYRGFEKLDLNGYLQEADRERVCTAAYWRRQLEE